MDEKEILYNKFSDLVTVLHKVMEKESKCNFPSIASTDLTREERRVRAIAVGVAVDVSRGKLSRAEIGLYLGGINSATMRRIIKKHKEMLKCNEEYSKDAKEILEKVKKQAKEQKIIF